jgi:hypothetical protein
MSASDRFDLVVSGVGGHAAMPHTTKDPLVCGAALVGLLQSLVSRETSPLDSAVVSVTKFHAGHAYNVIPAEVKFINLVFKSRFVRFFHNRNTKQSKVYFLPFTPRCAPLLHRWPHVCLITYRHVCTHKHTLF